MILLAVLRRILPSHSALLVIVLTALACLACARPALCDRVLLSPTGATLFEGQWSAEALHSFAGDQATGAWASVGLSRVELEAAYFHAGNHDAAAVGLETPLLPETFATPALAVGVRDIFNTTRDVRTVGYGGRAFYAALTKSVTTGGPFQDVKVSAGVGAGSIHGLFASVTATLPLRLQGSFEYDGSRANLRIALPVGRIARLEYARVGPRDFFGLSLSSPAPL